MQTKLNENGDIATITHTNEVAESIRHRLLVMGGEWEYDRELGINYYDDVLRFGISQTVLRTLIANEVNDFDEVQAIKAIETTNVNRNTNLNLRLIINNEEVEI